MDGDEREPIEDEAVQPRIKPRRIDAAHTALSGNESPAHAPAGVNAHALAGDARLAADEAPVFHELPPSPPLASDDVSLETEQLADALAQQLRELDERQAALAAREAELENEWRQCRAWHQEQLAALSEREALLSRRTAEMDVFTRREEELAERFRDCEAEELALDERAGKLNEREASLVAREHELRDRRQQVEREAAALTRSQQLWQQTKTHDEQALDRHGRELEAQLDEQLAERMAEIEATKTQLAEQARAIEHDRASLRRERDQWQQEREREVRERSHELQNREDEVDRRLTAVSARESALDTQQAALEQLRGEMTGAYRQALEMRLIAEQIWAQLKGLMTPAEITQSLAQLRLKMAEQYEQEEKALAARKEELLALADKLAQQHAALKAQRMEFLAWRKKQQEEIAHQAEHLCRRVQELSEERKQLKRAA